MYLYFVFPLSIFSYNYFFLNDNDWDYLKISSIIFENKKVKI